jgi:hypothetical protein
MSIYDPFIGRVCLIRAHYAGVHIGRVSAIEGRSVSLSQGVRRLWRWRGAAELHQVASEGLPAPSSSAAPHTRLSRGSAGQVLIADACEVLVCSPEAIASFSEIPEWVA